MTYKNTLDDTPKTCAFVLLKREASSMFYFLHFNWKAPRCDEGSLFVPRCVVSISNCIFLNDKHLHTPSLPTEHYN